VGKTTAEMEMALEAGILMFNLESEQELLVLNEVAGRLGRKAPISFRVNPDVDPKTHPKITTGLAKNKFGLGMEIAFAQYQAAARLPHVEVRGVSFHIGSQITQVEPFADALERVALLVERLRKEGMELQYVDIGGGLGIPYRDEEPPPPEAYAQAVSEIARRLDVTLILEPGRVLTGNAGILLTRVLYTKRTPAKRFVVVDAAMNDLVRPTLYGAYHHIQPVVERPGARTLTVDVVGPICESGDFLAQERDLPAVERGDLLAVMSAGAYGFSMASNYNSRPRPAEVLVNGDRFAVVRERESLEDLSRGERVAPWME
jgi:diaminopimelate decarboxylase